MQPALWNTRANFIFYWNFYSISVTLRQEEKQPERDGAEMVSESPRDFPGLRAEIVARREHLPKRLAQVATFAVGHPDEIAFGTAASVAAKAEVQPSTLVRFSQALGYQGFTDLQAVFRQHFRERVPDYETRLKALSGTGSHSKIALLFDSFCDAGEKSIAAFRRRMDYRNLERAVEILARAETIYLVGIRRSFPVVSYMAYAFGKLGVRNTLIDLAGGLAVEEIGFARETDTVFGISFAPYANDTVALVGQAASHRVPIVSITDSPFSPLAKDAAAWFEVVEADVEGFRSLSASFALAMTLTVAVAERRRED
jgi:DNA-binding MurR/RpiR family transcriptional regulator